MLKNVCKKCHFWNIVFHNGKPMYIDIRDFEPGIYFYNNRQHINDIARIFNKKIDTRTNKKME